MKTYSHDKESVIVTILLIYLFSYLICSALEIQKQLQYSRTFEQSRKVQTMGKSGHLPSPGNAVKCFCAVKYKVFMHYFQYMSSASGGLTPGLHQGFTPESCWVTSIPQTL